MTAFITLPQNPVVNGQGGHLADHENIQAALQALWQAVPQGRINVKAPPYNAAGDGVTDDTTAIQNALNACPVGGVVFFPNGVYEISSPLTIVAAGTKLQGEKAATGFSAGGSNQTVIDAKTGFTGAEMIQANGIADFAMRDLTIHATNTSGTTIGINIVTSGSCVLENVLVARTAGDGIYLSGVDPVVMRQVGVYHAGVSSGTGYGINIQGISDSWYTSVLCAGCQSAGWNIQGGNNSQFIGCRAEDGAGYGFYMHDVAILRGGTIFSACSTDLNTKDGMRLANLTSGNGAIQIVGCQFRRDGNNAAAGGGSYAGIAVSGCTMPVIIDASTVTARQGDSGGADAPQYGLNMTTSSLITVDGGYFSCAASGGSVFNHDSTGVLQLGPNMIAATVSASTPTVYQLGEIVARKTSSQSVNNSTTLVNDTQLVTPSLLPGSVWLVDAVLFYDASTAGDIKMMFTGPAGSTFLWSGAGAGTGASAAPVSLGDQQRTLASAATYGGVGVGTIVNVLVRGILTIGASAGALQLQFAQNTLDATNCTVDVGSFLRLKQIA